MLSPFKTTSVHKPDVLSSLGQNIGIQNSKVPVKVFLKLVNICSKIWGSFANVTLRKCKVKISNKHMHENQEVFNYNKNKYHKERRWISSKYQVNLTSKIRRPFKE